MNKLTTLKQDIDRAANLIVLQAELIEKYRAIISLYYEENGGECLFQPPAGGLPLYDDADFRLYKNPSKEICCEAIRIGVKTPYEVIKGIQKELGL